MTHVVQRRSHGARRPGSPLLAAAAASALVAGLTLACALALVAPLEAQTSRSERPSSATGATGLPDTIPLFPLAEAVLFPNGSRPLVIFEPRYRAMVGDALNGNRIIGMVTLQPGHEQEYDGRPPIHAVGCAGRISEVERLPDGRYTLVLSGITRFRVLSEDHSRPYRVGRVEAIPEVAGGPAAALRADRQRLETILSTQGIEVSVGASTDEQLIDVLAQYVEMPSERRQALLEMGNASQRARALIEFFVAR